MALSGITGDPVIFGLLLGPLGDFVVAQVLVLEAPRVVPGEEPLLPPVVSLLTVLDLQSG